MEVLFETSNRIGWVRLNRPKVINALTGEMISEIIHQLEQWKQNADIRLVCISGEGEKGFCAGGDMVRLYKAKDHDNFMEMANELFAQGYRMDFVLHQYPIPVLVYMDGIVMGGGAGIGSASRYRVVTERTKWAMPELNIGFYPDVGSSYFLNRMPGNIGLYAALTSAILSGEDLLSIDAADFYVNSSRWADVENALRTIQWKPQQAESQLVEMLQVYSEKPTQPSRLSDLREKIERVFSYDSIEEIKHALEISAGAGDPWAEETLRSLNAKPPTSLKVTLRQFQLGRGKPLLDCLQMELGMSMRFMSNPDFFEGVRAVLVDKDRKPRWRPSTLEEVTQDDVSFYFRYEWPDRLNPLADLAVESTVGVKNFR